MSRHVMFCLGVVALLAATGSAAAEEAYPNRSIKLIVPFAAAGVQDIVARIVFENVSASLRQPVIIENRPGAGGTLAMAAAAAAKPDGYTLVISDPRGSLPAAASLYSNLPYDATKSFAPIAMVGYSGAVLSVGRRFPAATITEFVARAKAHPGEFTYASTGVGTPGHLNGELFKRLAGIEAVHVPYRSVSQGVTDLMESRVSFWISPVATVLPQISEGYLRALAVASRTRLNELPDVPTMLEAGNWDYDASTAYAFFSPSGTPPEVIATLQAAVHAAVSTSEVRRRLMTAGVNTDFAGPEVVRGIVIERKAQWAEVIKASGIKLD